MRSPIRAISFDAAVAGLAPVALVVAARHREAPAHERPVLHLPLPIPTPRDTRVPEQAREHDADPASPTRGVNVFDMV